MITGSMKGGIQARGNTLDQRLVPKENPSYSQAAASYSTTVGVSSHNASRPGSAIKKKLGVSPPNNGKTIKINSTNQKDLNNLLYYSSKHSKKPTDGNVIMVNQTKQGSKDS